MMNDVYCDICEHAITRFNRCTICQFGEFDICEPCVEEGHWCLDRNHELTKFEFQAGKRIEIERGSFLLEGTVPPSRHYTYEPLPAVEQTPHVRLLTVCPSKPDEDLKANIQSFPLHEAPEYEALSYCWGPIHPIHAMLLNGKRFAITPNLFMALWHITVCRDKPLVLWVDAICINQSDNAEKAQQVGMMREIYEGASRTIVWLGPDEDDHGRALTMCLRMLDLHGEEFFSKLLGEDHWKVLEDLLAPVTEDPSVVERRRKLYFRSVIRLWSDHGSNFSLADLNFIATDVMRADASPCIPPPGFERYTGSFTDHLYASPLSLTQLEQEQLPSDFRSPRAMGMITQFRETGNKSPVMEELVAARSLFTGPWFNRIWIVQETVVAKEIVFQYGVNRIPGWAIYAGLKIACDLKPILQSGLINFTVVWSFRRALCRNPEHRHEKHKGMRDLISLLKNFRLRDATDARDKIYALLGITSDDVNKLGITVRYDRSIEDTYIETAIAIINSTNDLSLFELLKPKRIQHNRPKVPSWVPDWSDTTLLTVLLAGGPHTPVQMDTPIKPYSATSTSSASTDSTAMNGRLRSQGYICDIITGTAVVMPDADVEIDTVKQVNTPCRSGTMYTKFEQVKRLFEESHARLKIYQAWHSFAHMDGTDGDNSYPTGETSLEAYKATLQTAPSTPSHSSMEEFEVFQASIPKRCEILETMNAYPVDSLLRPDGTPKAALLTYQSLSQEHQKQPEPPQFTCAWGRRLMRTANGYLGLAPAETEIGDSVAMIKGAKTPVVLREEGENWIVVGSVYVHGMMYGEMWDITQCYNIVLV